jgi:hypothetical protein
MTEEEALKVRKLELVDCCKAHGIARLVVEYSGEGDSGEVCGINAYDYDNNEMKLDDIAVRGKKKSGTWDQATGQWREKVEEKDMPLSELAENLCTDFLDDRDIDWYNNDGGYGTFTIHVTAGQAALDHNYRITTTEEEGHIL